MAIERTVKRAPIMEQGMQVGDEMPVVEVTEREVICATCATLRADLARAREEYHELIMAVERKCPNETRHQTALRYIRQAETPSNTALAPDAERRT